MSFIYSGFADEASPDFPKQVEALKRNGYSHIELRNVGGQKLTEITETQAREMKKLMDDNGIAVWSMGSPIGKMKMEDSWQSHLDDCRRVLDLAGIFGATRLRMFSFYMPKGEDPVNYKSWVFDHMAELLEVISKWDILPCHENEKGIYGDLAPRCVELHQAFPQLKAVFDPANFVQCGQETLSAWEQLNPYVDYMHIKDALPSGRVVPAGQGHGNVQAILRKYAAQGGKVVSLEPHLTKFVGLQNLEAEIVSEVGALHFENTDQAFDYAAKTLYGLVETL